MYGAVLSGVRVCMAIIIPNSAIGYLECLNPIFIDKEHVIIEGNTQNYQGIIGIMYYEHESFVNYKVYKCHACSMHTVISTTVTAVFLFLVVLSSTTALFVTMWLYRRKHGNVNCVANGSNWYTNLVLMIRSLDSRSETQTVEQTQNEVCMFKVLKCIYQGPELKILSFIIMKVY